MLSRIRTKKHALDIGFQVWTWLAKNPGKNKSDWPFAGLYPALSKCDNCACCVYANYRHSQNKSGDKNICRFCPVTWHSCQHKPCFKNVEIVWCGVKGTPFALWRTCRVWIRKSEGEIEAAKGVAELHRQALERLDG